MTTVRRCLLATGCGLEITAFQTKHSNTPADLILARVFRIEMYCEDDAIEDVAIIARAVGALGGYCNAGFARNGGND